MEILYKKQLADHSHIEGQPPHLQHPSILSYPYIFRLLKNMVFHSLD